jgi:hypothetical protein
VLPKKKKKITIYSLIGEGDDQLTGMCDH